MNRCARFIQHCLPSLRCVLCNDIAQGGNLCRGCLGDLPVIVSACAGCGASLPVPSRRCGRCLDRTQVFDSAASAFRYEFPVDLMLCRLKFAGRLDMARALGEATATVLKHRPHARFEAVVPVPLHWQRCWRRGFNQALELARPLSHALRLPLAPELLCRRVATREQSHLDAARRRVNVHRAFAARTQVRGARLIVFDDVLTTGATAAAAAQALREAGAREVMVMSCARAGAQSPSIRP